MRKLTWPSVPLIFKVANGKDHIIKIVDFLQKRKKGKDADDMGGPVDPLLKWKKKVEGVAVF